MITYEGSVTARICAWARAYYSKNYNQHGFNDYLAEKIIEDDRRLLLSLVLKKSRPHNHNFKKNVLDMLLPIPISRSIFAEQEFLKFKERNPHSQYVVLGSGLDTFSLREQSSDVTFFEVDKPTLQNIKKSRIDNLYLLHRPVFVPVDFNKESLQERLKDAGFVPDYPTFVTVMGVSYYLNYKTFMRTLEDLSHLSTNLTVLFDFYEETQTQEKELRFERLRNLTDSLGEPMREGYKPRIVINALKKMGFKVSHLSPDVIKKNILPEDNKIIQAYSNIHLIKAVKN